MSACKYRAKAGGPWYEWVGAPLSLRELADARRPLFGEEGAYARGVLVTEVEFANGDVWHFKDGLGRRAKEAT